MAIDTGTLLSKIVDRAAQRCGHLVPSSMTLMDDGQKTEMLADLLATQLMKVLGFDRSAEPEQPTVEDLQQVCADQIRRNQTLARALGACDCWGELTTCSVCDGAGGPGWRRPQMAAFNTLILPVISRMNAQRARTNGTRVPPPSASTN